MPTTTPGLCMGCMNPLSGSTVCSHCGYDPRAPYNKQYKKPGSLVGGRYLVGRLVRKNGEGAIYLGYDVHVQKKVWVREYFPSTLAVRDVLTGNVSPKNECGAQFKALMSDFVDVCNEVKRMGVTEPVVPIENMVGENGTVMAIYKYMGMASLEKWLAAHGGKLSASEACDLLLPLFNSLSNLHARGVIHRGISPYTIYIGRDNRLYLWDFCMSATRTDASELEAELFTGYSAPEQYASNGWQGTWTDVYGAAALFYRAVSGFVPPKSTTISPQRPLAPLIDLAMDVPPHISDAVLSAMAPDAALRTQEIGPFVAKLLHSDLSNTAVYDASIVNEVKKSRERRQEEKEEKQRRRKYIFWGLLITVAVLGVVLWMIMGALFPDLIRKGSSQPSVSASQSQTEQQIADASEVSAAPGGDQLLPDLTGQNAQSIVEQYKNRFKFELREEYNAQYDAGIVYDQSPPAGIKVLDGRNVILYVSKGKQIYTMPDLTGMTLAAAVEALKKTIGDEDVDLLYSSYPRHSDANVPAGTVVGTTPTANAEFDPQTTRISIFTKAASSVSEATQVERQSSSAQYNSQPDSWRDSMTNTR